MKKVRNAIKRPYETADGRRFATREAAIIHILKTPGRRIDNVDYIYLGGNARWKVYLDTGAIEDIPPRNNPARVRCRERFREPDAQFEDEWAVWYGPDGPGGDFATEVEHTHGNTYVVREYQNVEGYIEEYDPDEPFLVTETHVEADDVREAAAKGVSELQESGGEEYFVSELPR